MTFRKEKKFKLSKSDFLLIKEFLLKNGMTKLYPERLINSCYFDTKNLKMFFDSEQGILPRKKIRLRWYCQNKSLINKEIKISSIEGRFKIIKKKELKSIGDSFKIKYFDLNYGNVYPTLSVHYKREYYKFKDVDINYPNINL